MSEQFICHRLEHPDADRFAAIYGCEEPEDECWESRRSCDVCAACLHHDEEDPRGRVHGKWYIGPRGYGFRTNRCPRCWGRGAFVEEVRGAYSWSESPGGGFIAAYGSDPPALLIDAVTYLRAEVGAMRHQEFEDRKKERESGGDHK